MQPWGGGPPLDDKRGGPVQPPPPHLPKLSTSAPTQVVFSNILPALPIFTKAEYNKRTTRHLREWFTFFVLGVSLCNHQ